MNRVCLLLPGLLLLSCFVKGQNNSGYDPPTYVRYDQEHLPTQVDILWSPPPGWSPSPVDKWIDWDLGLWDGNSLGSCMDCPAEAGSKWDAATISMYDTVYLTKIRYVLTEPTIHYALKVYQGTPDAFDTLLVYPLEDSIIYNLFDTLYLQPVLLNTSKDLWLVYWVNSLASGYPLPLGVNPAMVGYGNLLNLGPGWDTLTSINPDIDYNWSIGGFLETPNDTIKYPLFNIYRAIDNGPYEMINQSPFLDTIYYDYIGRDLDPSYLNYYITCVYEDGESEPSDTLQISCVSSPENPDLHNLKIFPNPATNYLCIESFRGKINSIALIDNQGSILIDKKVGDEKYILDISQYNSSIYIIKTVTSEGIFTSKIIIAR
jgi:hypothetical protein